MSRKKHRRKREPKASKRAPSPVTEGGQEREPEPGAATETEKGTGKRTESGSRHLRDVLVDVAIVVVLIALFFALKSFALNPAVGDENIWFYSAHLMHQGTLPYRDFFFAHPPLHVVPGWLFLLLTGGFHLETFKLLPASAAAVAGVCVYGIARRAAGWLAGAAAMTLFLFNHDLLRASSHFTGINLAIAWMAGGLAAALAGRSLAAGVCLGLGVSTGVYVAPAAVVVCALLLFSDRPAAVRCALAAAAAWGLVNGVFWAIGGSSYFDAVFRYHLLKPPVEGGGLFGFLPRLLFHNFFVLTAPLFAAPLLVIAAVRVFDRPGYGVTWRTLLDPSRHPVLATGLWSTAVWIGSLGFLAMLGRVFDYYFLLLFPPAAVCGGLFVARFLATVAAARRSPTARLGAALMMAMVGFGFLIYPTFESRLSYYRDRVGKTKTYAFPRSRAPEVVQAGIKALFWIPDRVVGERYTGILFYLWHESREFREAEDMAAFLRAQAGEGETIFGDSTSTPLVSLLSGVPIMDGFVDTNAMRFHSGLPSVAELIPWLRRAMEREEQTLAWILLRPGRGIGSRTSPVFEPFRVFLKENFQVVKSFRTAHQGTYQLWARMGRG